jgi:hypothetical protein
MRIALFGLFIAVSACDSSIEDSETGVEDTAEDTADSGEDTGDSGEDTGDTGEDTGDTGQDTGDTGEDTGDTGTDEPVPDIALLEGEGYAIAYADMTWTKPNASVMALVEDLGGEIPIEWFAFQVEGVDVVREELDLVTAIAEIDGSEINEASCFPIIQSETPIDFSSNPKFVTPAVDVPYVLAGLDLTLTISGFKFSGTFEADGSAVNDVVATGLIDTRPLDTLAGADVCLLATLAGNPCVKCTDGTTECLEAEITGDRAARDRRVNIDRTYDYTLDPVCL